MVRVRGKCLLVGGYSILQHGGCGLVLPVPGAAMDVSVALEFGPAGNTLAGAGAAAGASAGGPVPRSARATRVEISTTKDGAPLRYAAELTAGSLESAPRPPDFRYALEAAAVCCAYCWRQGLAPARLRADIAFSCQARGKAGVGTSSMVVAGVVSETLLHVAEAGLPTFSRLRSPEFRGAVAERLGHLAVLRAQRSGSGYDVIACVRGSALVFRQDGAYLAAMRALAEAGLEDLDVERLHGIAGPPTAALTPRLGEAPEIALALRPPRGPPGGGTSTEKSVRGLRPEYPGLPEFRALGEHGRRLIDQIVSLLHADLGPGVEDISVPRGATFEDLRGSIRRHRELQRAFQDAAGVQIEPPDVREALDAVQDADRTAITVGAGGYDYFLEISRLRQVDGTGTGELAVGL